MKFNQEIVEILMTFLKTVSLSSPENKPQRYFWELFNIFNVLKTLRIIKPTEK